MSQASEQAAAGRYRSGDSASAARHECAARDRCPAASRRAILEPGSTTSSSARRLARRGHRAYLVGGSVRRRVPRPRRRRRHRHRDRRAPDVIEADRAAAGPTRSGCRASASGPSACEKGGDRFEITTFRAEVYRPESRKPEVTFSDDIETDLSRRDFTDQRDGARARRARARRPVRRRSPTSPRGGCARRSSPEVSFGDDPLRMLRAARFVAHARLRARRRSWCAAIEQLRDRLRDRQRRAHPRRAVEAAARRRSVAGLVAHRATAPGRRVPARAQRDASSSRTRSTGTRTCSRTRSRSCAKTSPRLKLRLAALLHDVGKPETRGSRTAGVTFHHHDVVGARWPRSGCWRCATRTTSSTT